MTTTVLRMRGLAAISAGTAGSQVIAVAAVPLLTRIYDPTDFGLFTVVAAVTMTLAAIAPLRFDLAVPLPSTDQEAYAVVTLGLFSTVLVGLVGTLGVALFGEWMAAAIGQEDLVAWLWAAPAMAAVTGVGMIFAQLAVRNRRYAAIGRRNIAQGVALIVGQLGAGLAGLRPGGLVAGLALGQVIGALSLIRGSGFPGTQTGQRMASLTAALVRYRTFPLLLAPSGLINVAGMQLPIVFIAMFYGDQTAGWLGLAIRVIALPVTLVGAAMAQVYLGDLTRLRRQEGAEVLSLFRSASRRLAVVAALQTGLLLAFAPVLFSVVFGAQWQTSGEQARALAVGVGLQLVAVPLSQTLIAFERHRLQFLWDLGRLLLVCGATVVAALLGWSAMTAIWVLGGTSAVAYGASWLLSWRVVRAATAASLTT